MRTLETATGEMSTSASEVAEDPLDIDRRLNELRELEDGWADGIQVASDWGSGYGKAPSEEGLDWLSAQFAACYDDELPKPYLFPMPEGGVEVVWRIGQDDANLEIDLETHSAEWHCLNFATDEVNERVLDLNTPSAWEWLANEVRSLGTVAE